MRFGWWSFAVFALFGLLLEFLHGFKVPAYMDVSNETRRLMWTLAHAHGTLLSLVNVLFGLTVQAPGLSEARQALISKALIGATFLLPGGFLLAGVVVYGGDPGLGITLVPAGAILLITASVLMARGSGPGPSGEGGEPPT